MGRRRAGTRGAEGRREEPIAAQHDPDACPCVLWALREGIIAKRVERRAIR
ncbi:hypothetical protein SFR_3622 [Streptomyces sp. FR-008]|nr:hypothetical protein SFR_3622 [Streptomyces sp. FR-008]